MSTRAAVVGSPLLEIVDHPGLRGPDASHGLALAPGELAFLGGESGSGKTRLLRQLVDLEPGLPGEARVSGTPIYRFEPAALRRRLGLLPQELPAHACSGRELLESIRRFGRNRAGCLDAAEARLWLELLELEAHLDKPIGLLSGGEKRRLSLLALLLPCPDVLLLDEPEAGLDARRRAVLDRFVARALEERRAVLWVSHLEPGEAFRAAGRYRLVLPARA
jgi:ABC-type multidrug transport system ATPase subunit